MTEETLYSLRFPIGEFERPVSPTSEQIAAWIDDIEQFPDRVELLMQNLNATQKNWPYRPGGWNIKQVVHHCSDSHINSIVRFKLALTEDTPTIRPYFEDRWVKLPDAFDNDLTDVLMLLTGLHRKWAVLLKNLTPEQLERTFIHPEHEQPLTVAINIALYAWHCNHHLAHIQQAIRSKGTYVE